MASENGQVVEDVAKAVKLDKPTAFTELGMSGVVSFGGRIEDEFLPELTGDRARKTFREMADNDPVVGAILFVIDMLLRQVEWRIEPAQSDTQADQAQAIADFVSSAFDDLDPTWEETLSSIFTMLPYGWSFHETVYKMRRGATDDERTRSKYNDGQVGWRTFALRGQDTLDHWELNDTGDVTGLWQISPPRYEAVFIPIEKALHFRTTRARNNPEGRSVLRNAYRPWFFKKRIEEIEGVGIERDLAGLPVAYVPWQMLGKDATQDQKATVTAIERITRNIRRDAQEGVVMPQGYDERGNKLYELTLLTTGGARQFDTDKIIGRYDQRIAMTVLADFILLGHENVGSFALGVEKVDVFTTAIATWLDAVAVEFNGRGIPALLEMNGVDPILTPKLEHADVKEVDIAKLAEAISKLAGAGMMVFPDQGVEDHLRALLGLPPTEGAEPT